jgi:hypothetical protein
VPSSTFALDPQYISVTNLRSETADQWASSVEFYTGQTIVFTNCTAYSGGSTSTAVQNLTGVTITVSVGTTATNHDFTGAAQVATNGTWGASFTLPTNWVNPSVWFKFTDSSTNVFIYPRKILRTAVSP